MTVINKNSRLSAQDRERLGRTLEKEYAAGKSLVELGELHGTSPGRVRTILLERGVTLRKRGGARRKPDPERAKAAKTVAKRYAQGASLLELARMYDCSPTTIRAMVLAVGGQMRSRGRQANAA